MTNDGINTLVYDAENHAVSSNNDSSSGTYTVDGNGLRVAKKSGANSDCTSGTVVKLYWRSLSGDALAETDSSGSTTNAAYNEYVFFSGRRVGSRNGAGGIFYWFADQLGTTRSITTGNGPGQTNGQLCYDQDYTPYGQEVFTTSQMSRLQTTACPPNYRFTGYEYDSETGLDYAFARYYSPRLGRFYSTDPLGGVVGSLQSHNAYAYTVNNPLNYTDPTGMWCTGDPGGGTCDPLHGGGGIFGYWTAFDLMNIPTVSSGYVQGFITQDLQGTGDITLWIAGSSINPVKGDYFNFEVYLLEPTLTVLPIPSSNGGGRGGGGSTAAIAGLPAPEVRPRTQNEIQACVDEAGRRAEDTVLDVMDETDSLPLKGMLKGAVSGGAIGCLVASEAGCVEGLIPFALVGGLRGLFEGGGEQIYRNTSAVIKARRKLFQDIQACQSPVPE